MDEFVSKFDSRGPLVGLQFRRQLAPNRLLVIRTTVGIMTYQADHQERTPSSKQRSEMPS